MIRINLLPAKVRETKGVKQLTVYLVIGGSAGALVLLLLLLNLVAQTRRQDVRLVALEKQWETLSDETAPLRQLMAEERTLRQNRAVVASLKARQGTWIRILNDLADRVQDDVWLTRLSSSREADAPLTIELEGEAYHKIAVADFLTALERTGRFERVSLDALSDVKSGEQTWVQFRLHFQVPAAEGS